MILKAPAARGQAQAETRLDSAAKPPKEPAAIKRETRSPIWRLKFSACLGIMPDRSRK